MDHVDIQLLSGEWITIPLVKYGEDHPTRKLVIELPREKEGQTWRRSSPPAETP